MAYCLRGLISRTALLRANAADLGAARVVVLEQGFGLLPATGEVMRALGAIDPDARAWKSDNTYLLLEGGWNLGGLAEWAERVSRDEPVAYVEAEFFGGTGSQGAVAWDGGALALGPVLTTSEPDMPGERGVALADWAINRALRLLGAQRGPAVDEFAALGLGRNRFWHWKNEDSAEPGEPEAQTA